MPTAAKKTDDLQICSLRLSDINPAAYNPRSISESALAGLTQSLSRFGYIEPIVVNVRDGKNVIVGGHQRHKVLTEMHGGNFACSCVTVDLDEADEELLNITLNNPHIQGEFIKELDAYLADVRDKIPDVNDYLDLQIDKLQADIAVRVGKTEDDDVPDMPQEAIAQLGDVWILGDHRVMCGDARIKEHVARLMGSEKADMGFTDPPYGVNYEGGSSNKIKREKVIGDTDTGLFSPCCKYTFSFTVDNAPLYLWHAGTKGIAAAIAATEAGYMIRSEIIWNKLKAHYGAFTAQYMQKHEPCYYCYKKGHGVNWIGPTNEVTVWEVEQASKNEFHPTQKPVELAIRAISNHKAKSVLDLFLGSGSTLIACEKLGRRCYGMEIDPLYCDVIVKRWEDWTGKKGRLSDE